MKSGRNYKKILMTLDVNVMKELKKLNPKRNFSKETRDFFKSQLEQELGLKNVEERDKE